MEHSIAPPVSRVDIRDATPADADEIGELHLASWRSAYRGIVSDGFLEHEAPANRLATWRARFAPENLRLHRVRVATSVDTLVGFACVSTMADPEWGYMLDNLHVLPNLKGRGLGRMLIADAATWIAEQQADALMHLWVYELNPAAREFYDRLGGVVESRVSGRAPDGGDAVTLRYVWRDVRVLTR